MGITAGGVTEGSAPATPERLPLLCRARAGELAIAGVLACLGGAFAAGALTLTLGDLDLPGSGFFPLALGLALLMLAAAIFVASLREPVEGERVELGHAPVLATLAGLLLVALLFERLGALISLGGFSAGMLVFVAGVRPLPAMLASVLGMLAVWYVFKVLLGVQLPPGLLSALP